MNKDKASLKDTASELKQRFQGLNKVRSRRIYLITLIFILQFLAYVLIFFALQSNAFRYLSISNLTITIAMALFIITRKLTASYRISWLILTAIAPIFTILFYLLTNNSLLSKRSILATNFAYEQKVVDYFKANAAGSNFLTNSNKNMTAEASLPSSLMNFFKLAQLSYRYNGSLPYADQDIQYFTLGDDAWPQIKKDLLQAKRSICIEFYIVKQGKMLDECLQILAQKLAEGVEVYFLYDGACELLLNFDLKQTLLNLGAKAAVFMPISTKFTFDHNHRDHRKLIIIDGEIAYTGGINLADEYININSPYGHWKDAVIRIAGNAVKRMQAFFVVNFASSLDLATNFDFTELLEADLNQILSTERAKIYPKIKQHVAQTNAISPKNTYERALNLGSRLSTKRLDRTNDIPNHKQSKAINTAPPLAGAQTNLPNLDNYVIPYADAPSVGNSYSENLYIQALYNAQSYCYIMTPYLILSDELSRALISAATRGVKINLILPGIPDKHAPYALARSHYRSLLEAGVNIYEYCPGFVHAKVLVSDDICSFVGTVNFDFRSLYLNFENGVIVYDANLAKTIYQDYLITLKKCRKIDRDFCQKLSIFQKACGIFLRPLGPLL